jgi:hypothetical protein
MCGNVIFRPEKVSQSPIGAQRARDVRLRLVGDENRNVKCEALACFVYEGEVEIHVRIKIPAARVGEVVSNSSSRNEIHREAWITELISEDCARACKPRRRAGRCVIDIVVVSASERG